MSTVQLWVHTNSVFLVVTDLSENSVSSLDPGFQEAEACMGCWWLLWVFPALLCYVYMYLYLLLRRLVTKNIVFSWLEALTLLTQVFMFLSTKGDFALVPLEVNSEEHYSMWSDGPGDLCVNAFSFWKAKFRSLHTVLYWSLLPSPHCSIPWESVPSQWYHGCMYCSIYFVLFECGHHFVFFSSPTCTGTDTLSDNCSNSLSQFCSLNCHLCIPAPHESLVQVWHYKKWLAVSYSTPHCILHWTLVSGGIMYIVKNVDVVLCWELLEYDPDM